MKGKDMEKNYQAIILNGVKEEIAKYAIIPTSVMQAKDISDGDFRLLMFLYSIPDNLEITQRWLAEQIGCNRVNMNKKIRRLKEAGYLRIKKDEDDNTYTYYLGK